MRKLILFWLWEGDLKRVFFWNSEFGEIDWTSLSFSITGSKKMFCSQDLVDSCVSS
jgi:hypothetical protein